MEEFIEEVGFDRLTQWRAFDFVEPIGGRRGDFHAAQVCAAMFNALRPGSRATPHDFLLKFTSTKRPSQPTQTKEGKPEQPEAVPTAAPHWKQMQLYARMHVAVSNADAKANAKRRQKGRKI